MVIRSYIEVLRAPHAAAIAACVFVGRLWFGMLELAVILLVREATGSFALAGAALAAFAVTVAALAPVRGRLVDRYGPARALAPMALLNAAALGGLLAAAVAGATAVVLTALTALAGAVAPPLIAATRTLWSATFTGDGQRLQAAYALDAVLGEVALIAGPTLAGAIVALASPAVALGVGIAMILTGTLGIAAVPPSRGWAAHERRAGRLGALAAPGIRTLTAIEVMVGVAVGVLPVAVAASAQHARTPAIAGALLALLSAGSLLGGLVYGARPHRGTPGRRYTRLLGVLAVGLAPLAFAPSLAVLAALLVLAGVAIAPATVCIYLLLDELAPSGRATEAFTWITTATAAGGAVGAALAGALAQAADVPWAFAAAALAAAAGCTIAHARRRRLSTAQHG